jgi:hypothetical protein
MSLGNAELDRPRKRERFGQIFIVGMAFLIQYVSDTSKAD